jgi:N-sulfoglucosamine sulfohydrolase
MLWPYINNMSNLDSPNFLWLVMEDTSPRFGCYGDNIARTPNIDSLADEGRRYTNAFCTAGVCAPSRASLMTGMYPSSIRSHHMRTATHDVEGLPDSYDAVPPHYVTAFTEHLRSIGYYCTLDLKTDYQFGEPFTMWDHHGENAGWWDDDRADGQPFFCMMTNGVTHESGMWDPINGGEIKDPRTNPDTVDVPPYLPDTELTRVAIARQYDNIAKSDAWIGDILERLARDGHAEETIVVLTSDHGEGLPRKKRWPYDSGTNVPLIVRWPGETTGGVRDDLISLVDLPPTMLSLAGTDPPAYLHGDPFLESNNTHREYVFSTRDRYDEEYDMIRSVRDDRFRYVRNYYSERPYVLYIPYRNTHPAMQELLRLYGENSLDDVQRRWFSDSRPPEELYDLQEDPHEVTNIATNPEYEAVLERFRDVLDNWRTRTGDRGVAEEDEAQMRNRCWPEGEQPRTATPAFVPNAPGNRSQSTTTGGRFDGPMTVSIYCPTQGASIGYTTDTGTDPHWKLFNGPLRFEPGETVTVRTKAVRYGYKESSEIKATFTVG